MLPVPPASGILASLGQAAFLWDLTADTIVQNASPHHSATDVTFAVAAADLARALEAIGPAVAEIGAQGVVTDDSLGKVSIVGTGVLNTPGYAPRMFQTLADAGINIDLITTSEIRITCILAQDRIPDAVRALHAAFELEKR